MVPFKIECSHVMWILDTGFWMWDFGFPRRIVLSTSRARFFEKFKISRSRATGQVLSSQATPQPFFLRHLNKKKGFSVYSFVPLFRTQLSASVP